MREERWVPLVGYPGYSISSLGRVRNDKRESVLTVRKKQEGYAYVGLVVGGTQVNRSLSKLVSETFLPKPTKPTFTTPIHFDGDMANCRVDNLDWRPRWFAIKHTRQFRIQMTENPRPIRELETGETFENTWEAVFQYGLLYMDVIISILRKTHVFPTMQHYEWLQ